MTINNTQKFAALACDYDGTIATSGIVSPSTIGALETLRKAGFKTILVSGRRMDHLSEVFTRFDLFDCLVLENGGVLYWTKSRREVTLAPPPSPALIERLAEKQVKPLVYGRVVVATETPYDREAREILQDLGLPLQIILNKGAVMILPNGVDKASGLMAALNHMKLSPDQVVGVGDAENDLCFLKLCGLSVAVGNALPDVKAAVGLVTGGIDGAGTEELIGQWMEGKTPPFSA